MKDLFFICWIKICRCCFKWYCCITFKCNCFRFKPGDKVITTPITFVATANCISYCGADVVFSDIDPLPYLIDLNKVEKLLINDVKNEIKGIIPVNFSGRVVNMEELKKLALKYNCWIIEDACHFQVVTLLVVMG